MTHLIYAHNVCVSEYKNPIKYDEYMEGGIPDTLLEGLGFSDDLDPSRDSPPAPDSEEEQEQEHDELEETRMGLLGIACEYILTRV